MCAVVGGNHNKSITRDTFIEAYSMRLKSLPFGISTFVCTKEALDMNSHLCGSYYIEVYSTDEINALKNLLENILWNDSVNHYEFHCIQDEEFQVMFMDGYLI